MTTIEKYFNLDESKNAIFFLGDKLEIFVPQRFIDQKQAIIGDHIQSFGCLDLLVNDSIECGIHIPAMIEFNPVHMRNEIIDGDGYLVCTLNKGGKLLENLELIQDNTAPYFVWTEFITYGRMPKYVKYENSCNLFDSSKEITGKGIPVDHALYEIVMAYLYRDKKDKNIQYRHTSMLQEPQFTKLKDVSYAMDSTHTKLIGSYSADGLNSSLITTQTENNKIEELFRE